MAVLKTMCGRYFFYFEGGEGIEMGGFDLIRGADTILKGGEIQAIIFLIK